MSSLFDIKDLIIKCINKDNYERNNLKIIRLMDNMNDEERKQLFEWALMKYNDNQAGYYAAVIAKYYKDDKTEQHEWYRKGADTEDPTSMAFFGKYCSSLIERIIWLKKAAEAGSAIAYYELGELCLHKGDVLDGIQWYKKAAELGNCDAMLDLGCLYIDGRESDEIKKDYEEARKWLELASDADATHEFLFLIGHTYREEKKYIEALDYYVKALDKYNPKSIPDDETRQAYSKAIDTLVKDHSLEIARSILSLHDKVKKLEQEIQIIKEEDICSVTI
ncbi:MAG: hypothetical protein Harvfovirus13_10 [Harvfovirus sp.]|uniref:Sel1 repeat family protein n=1 Tax=Harvfovirus sp. TaxID=2487768 RepID=A0A3G5A3F4_9VIRU|nr:MAG: hypothetical protein Harvfovirus13_10 [Harvfovirus sp.]